MLSRCPVRITAATGEERHDEELGAAGQSQQTSGEPDSVVPEEAQYTDLPLDAEGYPVE